MVGRALALGLARQQLEVALCTRAPAPDAAPDVRAYALNAASRQLLEGLRAWPAGDAVTEVSAMEVHGDDGGRLHFSASDAGGPALAWIVDVPPLEQALATACAYQPGIQTVQAPVPAALTVICEGRASAARSERGGEYEVRPYGHSAIACRLHGARPHGGIACQWFAEGEVMGLLPMGGPSGNLLALVWSVAHARLPELLDLSDDAFAAAVTAASQGRWGDLSMASPRAAWPLVHASARHWVGPGWALAGDAAHAVHPLAGQGLNLGLGDVAELLRLIGAREPWRAPHDLRLLRRYERHRKAALALTGGVGDGLQALFARRGVAPRLLRNAGMSGFDRLPLLKQWAGRMASGLD